MQSEVFLVNCLVTGHRFHSLRVTFSGKLTLEAIHPLLFLTSATLASWEAELASWETAADIF